jgi:hypothetical protein
MSDEHNGSGKSRLDRLENLMELLINDHVRFDDDLNRLLTAQVVLTDRVDKLAVSTSELAVTMRELAVSQKHTDERLNALIHVVDDLIRNRPSQPPQ